MATDGKVQAKFRITEERHTVLRKYADARNNTMSREIELLIDEVIEPDLKDIAPELDLK